MRQAFVLSDLISRGGQMGSKAIEEGGMKEISGLISLNEVNKRGEIGAQIGLKK